MGQLLVALLCCAMVLCAGCDSGGAARPGAPPGKAAPAARRALEGGPAAATPSPAPGASPPSDSALSAAIAVLEGPLRSHAGDPDNGWALAHGIVGFGREFKTRTGELAVDRLADFLETTDGDGVVRHGFPAQRGGQPVEPHPHMVVRALLQAGVPLDQRLPSDADGAPTVGGLLADLRAGLGVPSTARGWQEVAWGMDAVTLGHGAVEPPAGLRAAALSRLEAEQAVVAGHAGPAGGAFGADTPLGAAKRGKRAIFAHACGGLHFAHAVLRSVARAGVGSEKQRAMAQVWVMAKRFELERHLYRNLLQQHPDAALVLSRQQLKFFGHLAEVLQVAPELCASEADRRRVKRLHGEVLGELVAAIARLGGLGAYADLPGIRLRDAQTYLDLVGDGCHALAALRGWAVAGAGPGRPISPAPASR